MIRYFNKFFEKNLVQAAVFWSKLNLSYDERFVMQMVCSAGFTFRLILCYWQYKFYI